MSDEAIWAEAALLLTDGTPWDRIAATTGISTHRLKARLMPGYAERRRAQVNAARGRKVKPAKKGHRVVAATEPMAPIWVSSQRPLTNTGRLMGDPAPGRSALDERQRGATS